jgi:hypothetical protein
MSKLMKCLTPLNFKDLYKKQYNCQYYTTNRKIYSLFKNGGCGPEHPEGGYGKEQERNPKENSEPKQWMP